MLALLAVALTALLTVVVRRSVRRPQPPAPVAKQIQSSGHADAAAAPPPDDAHGQVAIDVELWRLPGALPGLGPVAPPLQANDLLPRIAGLVRRGQVSQSDALHAARAVWPALARCGIDRQRQITATFALAGGQTVGSSAIHGAVLQGAIAEAERSCVLAGLAQVQAPVATDCQGEVEVHFGGATAGP